MNVPNSQPCYSLDLDEKITSKLHAVAVASARWPEKANPIIKNTEMDPKSRMQRWTTSESACRRLCWVWCSDNEYLFICHQNGFCAMAWYGLRIARCIIIAPQDAQLRNGKAWWTDPESTPKAEKGQRSANAEGSTVRGKLHGNYTNGEWNERQPYQREHRSLLPVECCWGRRVIFNSFTWTYYHLKSGKFE